MLKGTKVNANKTISNIQNMFNQNMMPSCINNDSLKLKIESYINCAVVGDDVEYKVIIKNNGNKQLKDIVIYSELDKNIKFLQESVKINNIPFKIGNITSGIEIGDLDKNETKILIFKVEILDDGDTKVFVDATFKYEIANNIIECSEAKSNLSVIEVKKAELYMSKSSDLKEVGLGDTITYKVLVVNEGNIDAINISFKDLIDKSTELVEDSFKVNGETIYSVDLEEGVRVGSLEVLKTMDIEYKVRVTDTSCTGNIINVASVKYEYVLSCGICGVKNFEHTQVINVIKSRISSFKQIVLESLLELPECKPSIESVNEVKGEAVIKNCHLIETEKSISQEGQRITGYKLIMTGYIDISLDYTAYDLEQAVHSAHYKVYFTDFVVLSNKFVVGSKIKPVAEIEAIYHKLCGDREVYINPTILLNVKVGNF